MKRSLKNEFFGSQLSVLQDFGLAPRVPDQELSARPTWLFMCELPLFIHISAISDKVQLFRITADG
jgi:hypothetical protein